MQAVLLPCCSGGTSGVRHGHRELLEGVLKNTKQESLHRRLTVAAFSPCFFFFFIQSKGTKRLTTRSVQPTTASSSETFSPLAESSAAAAAAPPPFKISYADLNNAADGQIHFDGQKDAAGVLPPHRGP